MPVRWLFWGRCGVMVSFYTSFGKIKVEHLSLIRPIEPVIDDIPSEIHGLVPTNCIPELIIEEGGARGYLEA